MSFSPRKIPSQRPVQCAADTAWSKVQHDPQHTGRSPLLGPSHQPELLWTAEFPTCSGGNGGITITQDGSLLLPIGGCLQEFDPVKHEILWKYPYGGYSGSTPLVAEDGNIYWGYSMNFDSISPLGKTNWSAALDPNYVFGSSAAFGLDGNLYFMHDALWSFTPAGDFRWYSPYGEFGSHAAPTIGYNGAIYAGKGTVDLCSYRSDGSTDWCLDTPGDAWDKVPAIGADGTIYMPAWGSLDPNATNPGVLTAISVTGEIEWMYQPVETNDSGIMNGMVIAPDGSIRFSLNTGVMPENFLYSVDATGQLQWKVALQPQPVTGFGAFMRYPLTTDRLGNTFVCPEDSRCYGFSPDGKELWRYQFPLADSIPVVAGTQPVIAADGLFYLYDNHYTDRPLLYAFADPTLYPSLKTPVKSLEYNLEAGSAPFTATIPITSTVAPITYTAWITPQVGWISIIQPVTTTPSGLAVQIDPASLPAGGYHAHLQVRPLTMAGAWLDIPVTLNAGIRRAFLPLTMDDSLVSPILYTSKWFVDQQIASIERDGTVRMALAHYQPFQIDWAVYAPDGKKAALVPYVDGKHQIDVVDLTSGVTILEIADPTGRESRQPTWSPGSDRLAFYSERDSPDGELYAINLDGTGLTRLTNNSLHESNLLWSPAGDRIAVEVYMGQMYLMNPDGSDFHPITPPDAYYSLQGWSPDGQSLLLENITDYGQTHRLCVLDLPSGAYHCLSDHYTEGATWSPDGQWIAFVGWQTEPWDLDIHAIRPDGSGLINLTYALDREDTQPAWSPDSRWLAFSSRRDDIANDLNYDIYAIRADGAWLKQVTGNLLSDYFPFWQK